MNARERNNTEIGNDYIITRDTEPQMDSSALLLRSIEDAKQHPGPQCLKKRILIHAKFLEFSASVFV
jgi:hypothetical protein